MTDNEIIKAYGCCNLSKDECGGCDNCPCKIKGDCIVPSGFELEREVFNLLHRQKAEIERLNKQLVFEIKSAYDRGTKAAVKEFAEELIKQYSTELDGYYGEIVWVDDIENLVKEKVGDIDV